METLSGPFHVIHRGDDAPVAIGTGKQGRTVAVWTQAPYRKHDGYAMEESVFNEMMEKQPRDVWLVDHKDKTVYQVDLRVLKHPRTFLLPDEDAMDEVGQLNAHGGGALVKNAADFHVEHDADTDEIQRLVPYDACFDIGKLESGKGSFEQVFADYRTKKRN